MYSLISKGLFGLSEKGKEGKQRKENGGVKTAFLRLVVLKIRRKECVQVFSTGPRNFYPLQGKDNAVQNSMRNLSYFFTPYPLVCPFSLTMLDYLLTLSL